MCSQKFDPGANAKGLAPGQLDMYTWQYCQGIMQSSVWLERLQGAISEQRSITFLFYVHTHFSPESRQNRLGLQKVDPSASAKGLAPGHVDTYTWQFSQGLWQRPVWLECPPEPQNEQRNIPFLFYENTFLVGRHREGTGFANFDPGTNAKGLAPGQLDAYTWKYCQGIRQSLVRRECP